ncbi:MAG: hypothetical protein H6827_10890 [Planctomycetes bacterium]|nr:hypothetical protein [Planctomycetota bacterium]
MNQAQGSAIAAVAILVMTGCETTSVPSAPLSALQRVKVPEIVATSDTQVTQGDSIKISVIPVTYTARVVRQVSYELAKVPPIVWDVPANSVYVQETVAHSLEIEPEYLRFLVKINNQLDRSFRGAGMVVQFNVEGRLIDVGQLNYLELQNLIVPPRSEKEVAIYGPSPTTLTHNAAIGVMFYDVVADTDDAGNVTKRENYEWVFESSLKEVQQSVPATTRTKKWIPVATYQEYEMKKHSEAAQQPWGNIQNTPAPTPLPSR